MAGRKATQTAAKAAPVQVEAARATTIQATLAADGGTVGVVFANAKTYRTGSKGYWGNGKLIINGRRYQVQLQLVEIGSKAS